MRESSIMEMLIKMYQDFSITISMSHGTEGAHPHFFLTLKQRKNQRQNTLEEQQERSEACNSSDPRGYNIE